MSPAVTARWFGLVSGVGCLVCRRMGRGYCPPQLHHTVDGDDSSVVPLCPEHHDGDRAGTGFHGMGEERFCLIFKVPGLTELGMLVWLNHDIAVHGPRML